MPDERPIGHSNTVVKETNKSIPWIWEGVVAEGAVTLLSAPEKIGKTTLLSLLLDRRREGGQLLGRVVYPGKTVLSTEESWRLWSLRQPPLDFGPDLIFHEPQGDGPTRQRWDRFIDDLCKISKNPFDLLVIDTAVHFLPLADRNKATLRWVFEELELVASFPAGVLILNQSRTVHRPLAAFADIVLEMSIPRAGGRRRTLTGVGRYPDTLQFASAELNAEGTDYILLPESPAPPTTLLPTLQAIMAASPTPLTRQEILSHWPAPAPRPDSLWRTLRRAVETGLLQISASGTKTDAFRYEVRRRPEAAAG